MFVIRLRDEWLATVCNFVHTGLKDPRVEVRLSAAEVLGGLLHCRILTDQQQVELRSNMVERVKSLPRIIKRARRSSAL